ncbi:MAG: sulfurtransferase [Gammaproteobacteria bacterium]|nr:sulfurtransferase [Gammaproteobacteria bacterium]
MSNHEFHVIAAYKFVRLEVLPVLQADLLAGLQEAGVLGTVLLADEGINLTLAGNATSIDQARRRITAFPSFSDLWFKESRSTIPPFGKLKVKIRHEIIAFDNGQVRPDQTPAPNLSPATLKRWLDEGREFTLLDTRNRYEVESGTFTRAESLPIDTFRDFPAAINHAELDRTKPVVTFCTGGVRCEKAAPWLLDAGFTEVYQVEGGIFNYFDTCGGSHWRGDCFVFDDRVEIDIALTETGAKLCTNCHRAVSLAQQESELFVAGVSCPACAGHQGVHQ